MSAGLLSTGRLSGLFLLAVTSAALTFGCAVGPRWRAPQAPAAAGYSPAALPQSSASAPIHGGEAQQFVAGRDIPFEWWELFQSPALNSLIEKALYPNPPLFHAQAALAQAQGLASA